MQLRFGFIIALSTISLAGCSSFAIKNGSLDYKETTTLDALQYPEGSMVRPATPLYPAPKVDPLALENAPVFENERGNRFVLPRPQAAQSSPLNPVQNATVGRPEPLVDGNKNPLLKVDGDTTEVWNYTLATLNSLNYTITSKAKGLHEVSIKVDQKDYVLRLTSLGANHTLALFNADNSFADPAVAAELLFQIYQNWPA
jgi:uncharacterized lipoprotein